MYPYTNPMMPNGQYQNIYQTPSPIPQRQDVVRVNGENGAKAYQMPANSSAILLDENNPIIWLVQTDGAGYKTTTPYTITPFEQAKQPDLSSIETRLNKLEEQMNNVKSNFNSNKQKKTSE